MSEAEQVLNTLLQDAHLAAPHELPALIAAHAAGLGGSDAVVYLADLQQTVLMPFVGAAGPGTEPRLDPLSIDVTLAGRVYQQLDVLTQASEAAGDTRVWLPLLDGTDRIGVLGVTVAGPGVLEEENGLLGHRLRRFAAVVAELIVAKTFYGDTIVRTRRRAEIGAGRGDAVGAAAAADVRVSAGRRCRCARAGLHRGGRLGRLRRRCRLRPVRNLRCDGTACTAPSWPP